MVLNVRTFFVKVAVLKKMVITESRTEVRIMHKSLISKRAHSVNADLIHSTDPKEITKYFLRQSFLTQEDTALIQYFMSKTYISLCAFLESFSDIFIMLS